VLLSQCPICPPLTAQSVSMQQAEVPMQSCPHFLVLEVQANEQVWVARLQVPTCPAPAIAAHSVSEQHPEVRTQVASLHAL
jgi:hypothetical protein